MTTRQTPHKQMAERPVRHLLTIQPQAMDYCCQIIARAIRELWRHPQGGHWCKKAALYVDEELRVYLLADTHASFDRWAECHGDWWVGTYVGTFHQGEDGAKVLADLAGAVQEDLNA